MQQITPRTLFFQKINENRPDAIAWVTGNDSEPQISGLVQFYTTPYGGILIEAEIFGLPGYNMQNASTFFAIHIHQNGDCTKPFDKVGGHYNPANAPHPQHAGDLVPLLGNQGYAFSCFYDKRFYIEDIIDRSVIIHRNPDDFTTQPSGNAGEMIACGVIQRVEY